MYKKWKLQQKIMGLLLTLCGIVAPYIDNDITASILFIPLGLYTMFTREKVIY